jgi:hypothetical protein
VRLRGGEEGIGREARLVWPAPVQRLTRRAGFVSHGGQGHRLIAKVRKVTAGDGQDPGVDIRVPRPSRLPFRV